MSSPRATVQRAALLAIGDEVLRGEIGNTNAAFIAERLFEAGIELAEHVVVSDDPQALRSALVRLRAEVDIIIATGGLGPTEDDRTVDVVADLLGTGTVAGGSWSTATGYVSVGIEIKAGAGGGGTNYPKLGTVTAGTIASGVRVSGPPSYSTHYPTLYLELSLAAPTSSPRRRLWIVS